MSNEHVHQWIERTLLADLFNVPIKVLKAMPTYEATEVTVITYTSYY